VRGALRIPDSWRVPLTRIASQSDLSPQAGRGAKLPLIALGFRLVLPPLLELGLRIADGLREHIAQFGLRFRGCFGDGCLPMCHGHYVGMPEGHLNPTKALYQAGLPNIPVQNASISALNNSASPGRLPILAPLRP